MVIVMDISTTVIILAIIIAICYLITIFVTKNNCVKLEELEQDITDIRTRVTYMNSLVDVIYQDLECKDEEN